MDIKVILPTINMEIYDIDSPLKVTAPAGDTKALRFAAQIVVEQANKELRRRGIYRQLNVAHTVSTYDPATSLITVTLPPRVAFPRQPSRLDDLTYYEEKGTLET